MATDTGIAKTHILFEDGYTVEVNLSLYSAPKGSNRPIDAYVVTECEGDFTRAARRAAEAVYGKLQVSHKLEPQVVGFDLHGLESGQSITGESGGLAFALALAKELEGHNSIPVAATGEIQSGSGGGPVSAIKGVVPKLEAALQLLPPRGVVFYPRGNESEVPKKTKELFKNQNIQLHAVATVNEAIDVLCRKATVVDKKTDQSKYKWGIISTAIFLALGIIYFFIVMDRSDIQKEIDKGTTTNEIVKTDVPEHFSESNQLVPEKQSSSVYESSRLDPEKVKDMSESQNEPILNKGFE